MQRAGFPCQIHNCRLLAGVLLEDFRIGGTGIWHGLPPVILNELIGDLVAGKPQFRIGVITLFDSRCSRDNRSGAAGAGVPRSLDGRALTAFRESPTCYNFRMSGGVEFPKGGWYLWR
jgi:hypothetical protein